MKLYFIMIVINGIAKIYGQQNPIAYSTKEKAVEYIKSLFEQTLSVFPDASLTHFHGNWEYGSPESWTLEDGEGGTYTYVIEESNLDDSENYYEGKMLQAYKDMERPWKDNVPTEDYIEEMRHITRDWNER